MLYPAASPAQRGALFVFAHGAGAGQSHPFMVRYARGLSARGVDVVTFNFPYLEAGRKSPDRAPVLEEAFRRVVAAAASHQHVTATRLFIGGKSMGGRMATHLAAAPDTWPSETPPLGGVVVFGYPLSPPGGPSRVSSAGAPVARVVRGGVADRLSHLLRIRVPTLIVQGTRDNFGGPDDVRRSLEAAGGNPAIAIHAVAGGDHSLSVPKSGGPSQAEVDAAVLDAVVDMLSGRPHEAT
jgi:predicted alpha/beta-hydrolase family hydrolase